MKVAVSKFVKMKIFGLADNNETFLLIYFIEYIYKSILSVICEQKIRILI